MKRMTHLEYIRELCKKPSDSFYFEIADVALSKCKDHELERISEVCQKTIYWRKSIERQIQEDK